MGVTNRVSQVVPGGTDLVQSELNTLNEMEGDCVF